jgi:hypothetical protein
MNEFLYIILAIIKYVTTMQITTDNANLLENGIELMIRERGFALLHIHDHVPYTYTYTVGLMNKINTEFVLAGKFSKTEYMNILGALVPKLIKRVKKRKALSKSITMHGLLKLRTNGVLRDAKIRIQRVHQSHDSMFTQAQHRSTVPIVVMQIVMFDTDGNLPGDPNWHDESMLQPDLTVY